MVVAEHLGVVRAAVEEDARRVGPAVVDGVVVDLDVIAALRGDDAVVHVVVHCRYGRS